MATKQQVKKLADKLGVEIDISSGLQHLVYLDAHKGKLMFASVCHCYTSCGDYMSEIWEDSPDALKMGLEDCTEENCEHCNNHSN